MDRVRFLAAKALCVFPGYGCRANFLRTQTAGRCAHSKARVKRLITISLFLFTRLLRTDHCARLLATRVY